MLYNDNWEEGKTGIKNERKVQTKEDTEYKLFVYSAGHNSVSVLNHDKPQFSKGLGWNDED
jgi:hypothetical protein